MSQIDLGLLQESLFHESNDAIFIFATDSGAVLEVNPAALRMTGWRRRELLGRPIASLISGADESLRVQLEQACRSTRFFHSREGYLLLQANGRNRDVNVSVSRLHGEDFVWGLVVARDISERKRGEELRAAFQQVLELLASRRPLSDVLRSLTLIAEQQVPGMRCSVLLLNQADQRLYHGVSPNLPEAYVRAIDGLAVGPEQGSCGTAVFRGERVIVADTWNDPLWAAFASLAKVHGIRASWSQPIKGSDRTVLGTFVMYHSEVRTPDERELQVIDWATHFARIAIEHHRTEDELQRQQAIASRVARLNTIGVLASGVAHEVTQPASAIVNFASAALALLERSPDGVASVRECLEEIQSAARRIGDILDRLRAYARGTVPVRVECRLNDLVREALAMLASEFRRRTVEVHLNLVAEEPSLFADPVQIQQVLVNMLMNSCQAIDELPSGRGEIWIETAACEGGLNLTIEDSGIGLSPGQDSRIFDSFVTTKKSGTGIGLPICRTIVEAHGGRIQLVPPTHGGAAFHVSFPITAQPASGADHLRRR